MHVPILYNIQTSIVYSNDIVLFLYDSDSDMEDELASGDDTDEEVSDSQEDSEEETDDDDERADVLAKDTTNSKLDEPGGL